MIWGGVILSFTALAFTSQALLRNITAADVKGAANINGLEFAQPEIDSMLGGLEDLRKAYTDNRAQSIPNGLSPAFYFNPVPAGYKFPQMNTAGGFSSAGNIKKPENINDLAYYSVLQLSKLISTNQITSEELTKFYIERLKKYDPKLKCVITLTEELALEQARKADQEIKSGNYKGMLHGIPYGIKDLFATKKYKTTWGATPYKDQVLDYNATVVERLEASGAVLVAKLSMGSLAWGDQWFGGKTRNPWDMESGSSGSSAGSAAAVSAGLLPFAIGTETYGSIVSPSAVCGVTGLRPTFGRVSRYGAMALSWTMDKIGPICRSAEDCMVVLQAIAGPDGKDQSVNSLPMVYNAGDKSQRFKIGYIKTEFDKKYPGKEQDSLALKALTDMGFELVALEWPKAPNIDFILDVEAAAAFDEMTRTNKDDQLERQMKMAWPNVMRTARQVPAVEYLQAQRLRTQLIEDVNKLFKDVSVIVHPATEGKGLYITNMTGHPSIALPNGLKDGKPTSITFTGKLYEEAKLAAMAQAYQDATGHHTNRPNIDNPTPSPQQQRKPAQLPSKAPNAATKKETPKTPAPKPPIKVNPPQKKD